MRGVLLLALALVCGHGRTPPVLTLELRVFNGSEEVTGQTRVTVHRAGERSNPVAQLSARPVPVTVDVEPGIYDVQAILERDGRVESIRWALRLVVMAYPDEAGRHLEVINFQNGFGALEVRRRDRTLADASLYQPGERTNPVVHPVAGATYVLFVVPAGHYDLQTRNTVGGAWQLALEVPNDRTRFWIVP